MVSLGGCSLAISGPQAHRKTLEPPVCDSGKGLVAVDSLAAIGFGVGGLAGLSESSSGGAIALVIAGLFTAAAVHGAGAADDCREAMEAYAQETNGVRLRYARKYDRARRDRDRARDDGEDREARRPRDARDARDARGAKTTTDRDARATPDADRDVDATGTGTGTGARTGAAAAGRADPRAAGTGAQTTPAAVARRRVGPVLARGAVMRTTETTTRRALGHA